MKINKRFWYKYKENKINKRIKNNKRSLYKYLYILSYSQSFEIIDLFIS